MRSRGFESRGRLVDSSTAEERRLHRGLAVAVAVCIGILTAVQARVNGALGAALGDGWLAALISFGSGLVVIAVVALAMPSGRIGLRRLAAVRSRQNRIPPWMLLGGLAGAVTVATQGLTVATIGVALFTVGVVAGQTVGGLVLDRWGYGPGGVVAVTMPRLIGGLLAFAGVVVCAVGPGAASVPWWTILLPFCAGAGISWQQGTNGRLRQRVGSPAVATLVNFAGGTAVLAVAVVVRLVAEGLPAPMPSEPWMYLGGAIGVAYIMMSAAVVRHTGVLLLGLGSVVGLLSASLVLDAVAPPPAGPSPWAAMAAVALALAGAAVVVAPRRRR